MARNRNNRQRKRARREQRRKATKSRIAEKKNRARRTVVTNEREPSRPRVSANLPGKQVTVPLGGMYGHMVGLGMTVEGSTMRGAAGQYRVAFTVSHPGLGRPTAGRFDITPAIMGDSHLALPVSPDGPQKYWDLVLYGRSPEGEIKFTALLRSVWVILPA